MTLCAAMVGDLTRIRAPQADDAGRVRLGYVAEGGDFDLRHGRGRVPRCKCGAFGRMSDLPLVLPEGEARLIAERWLTEARVAPRSGALCAAAVIGPWRGRCGGNLSPRPGRRCGALTATTLSGPREMEATRVEPGVYGFGETDLGARRGASYSAPGPVQPVGAGSAADTGGHARPRAMAGGLGTGLAGGGALASPRGHGPVCACRAGRHARADRRDRNCAACGPGGTLGHWSGADCADVGAVA